MAATTRKGPYEATYHRDGTVTYWSVYRQQWVRHADSLPDREWAAMNSDTRETVLAHLSEHGHMAEED